MTQHFYTLKLVKLLHNNFLIGGINASDRNIDDFKELVEAFDLPSRDLSEINEGRVAEDVSEEMHSLIFIE